MDKVYLTREEAAEWLTARGYRIARTTLQRMASTGGGPPYKVVGRLALYKLPDLATWLEAVATADAPATAD